MCRSSFDETLQDEVLSEKTSGLVDSLRSLSRLEVLFTTECSQSKHFCEMFTLKTLGSEENFNAR